MNAHGIEATIIRLTPQQRCGLRIWPEMGHTQPGEQEDEPEQDRDLFEMGRSEPDGCAAAD